MQLCSITDEGSGGELMWYKGEGGRVMSSLIQNGKTSWRMSP
jgi:hypothetical protein